jgi:2,4-dienoyl-CoA reductase-like NADH-dependent reductase (Old Yellow Enzyme family)
MVESVPESQFKHLFTPINIRNVTLRNRIAITPHGNRLSEANLPTPASRAYYEARAKGGVALMSTQTLNVYPQVPESGLRSTILSIWHKDSPRAIGEMIAAVHEHGAKFFGQIGYAGRQYDSEGLNRPVYAPSAIPWSPGGDVPREMTPSEISRFVRYFAETAVRVRECGYDGVEVHGAHGYLVHAFMSADGNQRTDDYGGSTENRARFALEIVRAIRAAVGEDFAVGIRLSGDEFVEGGLGHEELLQVVRLLHGTGCLDYYSIAAGAYKSMERIVPPPFFPQGVHTQLAANIRKIVSPTPVLAAGLIYKPVFAEQLIASGMCDIVGMLRAMIADPELPNKAARWGRGENTEPIRHCVGFMDCWRRELTKGLSVSCAINPEIGREFRVAAQKAPEKLRRVAVVGAGPAGLELSTRLARRGHSVVLFEREAQIGGQLRVAALEAGRERIVDLCNYFEKVLPMLPIDVRLGSEASRATIMAEKPDLVALATGSSPCLRPNLDGRNSLDMRAALCNPERVGARVIVYTVARLVSGPSVADTLARTGRTVTLATPHPQIGPGLDLNTFQVISRRLAEQRVTLRLAVDFVSWEGNRLILRDRWREFADGRIELEADTFVYDFGAVADDQLYREMALDGDGLEVVRLGDCLSPRGVQAAHWDALREALRL